MIVTGGNSGIGVETIRALAKANARVILAARNLESAKLVANEINMQRQPIYYLHMRPIDAI